MKSSPLRGDQATENKASMNLDTETYQELFPDTCLPCALSPGTGIFWYFWLLSLLLLFCFFSKVLQRLECVDKGVCIEMKTSGRGD